MINLLNLSKVNGENYAVKSIDLTLETGIRLDNIGLILEGAIPAAVLALLVQGLFDLSERVFVPQGLRLEEGKR